MKIRTGVWISLTAAALLLCAAALKNARAAGDDAAAVSALENGTVKADLTDDKAYYEKALPWRLTGPAATVRENGSTKADMLKMMVDTKNNKMNSEKITELKVRTYGDTAIATYKDTYDAMVQGEHRMRTVISTDTFVKQGGMWKEVASHASTASK